MGGALRITFSLTYVILKLACIGNSDKTISYLFGYRTGVRFKFATDL